MSFTDDVRDWWWCISDTVHALVNRSGATLSMAWSLHSMRHVDPDLHRDLLYAWRQRRAHCRRGTRGRRP